MQTHTFQRPGKYTIKLLNFGDKEDLPVTLRIQVLKEDREIQPSTGIVLVDSPVEFKAINFRASSLKWNWGDGSQGQGGPGVGLVPSLPEKGPYG